VKEKKSDSGWLAEIVMSKINFSNIGLSGKAVIGHWLNKNDTVIRGSVWTSIEVPIGSIVMVMKPMIGEILFEGKPIVVPKECIRRIDETATW